MPDTLSIVLPAKNEAIGLRQTLPLIRSLYPDAELIVVDDGSTDETSDVVASVQGAICVKHPVSIGNGGAIKSGARRATGDIIVFMDADGQHDPHDISRLLSLFDEGYDLVVGARSRKTQASVLRSIANNFYNWLASMMTGFQILDLTSGFRAVRRKKFMRILYLLPNKFSYPTTSTMAFFKSGYFVGYVPIEARQREGKSHISLLRDGLRFLIIILKIGALYSPMRLFLPISCALFYIASLYYLYTFSSAGRFTNMGMLLYLSSLLTFLIGIVSEQVSSLHYKGTHDAEL
ncbi:glycosyltransferase family 2 protein [Granulosicoccus antarcticus]|uniref:Undecaprenyl-phosphate 4-deoxy-4-formamido-L-arabinose transferase n=1 Tax=Granulosicoccus antarcticus IMCC3135 TaxID=1192854 RepID=A0A2Z2NWM8_9GAMM|nr:glycosyltransferase family 2 protein [Granulosicoccus antarcticus]ASJ75866.1 Undecaprenyl-phosphate 4-deoxy-4-formamido-L-arabinose transferase [Granulosicoccus antarcticus IMCC3135]